MDSLVWRKCELRKAHKGEHNYLNTNLIVFKTLTHSIFVQLRRE